MVSDTEVMKVAQAQSNALLAKANGEANDILADAKDKSTSMRNSAIRFVDDLMRQADDALYDNLSELRRARQSFKGTADAVIASDSFNEE